MNLSLYTCRHDTALNHHASWRHRNPLISCRGGVLNDMMIMHDLTDEDKLQMRRYESTSRQLFPSPRSVLCVCVVQLLLSLTTQSVSVETHQVSYVQYARPTVVRLPLLTSRSFCCCCCRCTRLPRLVFLFAVKTFWTASLAVDYLWQTRRLPRRLVSTAATLREPPLAAVRHHCLAGFQPDKILFVLCIVLVFLTTAASTRTTIAHYGRSLSTWQRKRGLSIVHCIVGLEEVHRCLLIKHEDGNLWEWNRRAQLCSR